jgi:hypothetical protein
MKAEIKYNKGGDYMVSMYISWNKAQKILRIEGKNRPTKNNPILLNSGAKMYITNAGFVISGYYQNGQDVICYA